MGAMTLLEPTCPVPTFAAAGFGVVGAQPYEALEALMERAGAERLS